MSINTNAVKRLYAACFNRPIDSEAQSELPSTLAVASGSALTLMAGVVIAATFTLTTGGDNITGSTGDDTFNGTYDAAVTDTFGANDFLNGNAGTDTLKIDHLLNVAITPPDDLWTHISNIEKIVINTTGDGAQTLTTGAAFQAAFAPAGVDLTTTTSGAGAINLTMTTFTGGATLKTTSVDGAQTIVTGSGATAVNGATTGAGALNIKGVGLASVLATTTGAGAQTIGDGSGNGSHLVAVTASSAGGAQAITSTSTSAVTVTATSSAGAQTIITGAGADVITASTTAPINTVTTNGGNDKIFILATATGNYTIDAGTGHDTMKGGAGIDTLLGGSGNDTMNGRGGADSMTGGDGSDLYYVNIATDVVTETNPVTRIGGIDTVYSSLAAYTLPANVENGLVLFTGRANLTGNGLNNVLYAGAGNNILNGSSGSDTASYLYAGSAVAVSLAITTAQPTGGSGSDTLISIENLMGSNYKDSLIGNGKVNSLDGNRGNDTLKGGNGNDILNGGIGADKMIGGNGSDVYYVDNASDVVTETNAIASTGGIDTVYSFLAAYTLPTNVERGKIMSAGAANLTGNSLNNILYAGSGDNVLNGGSGTDTAAYTFAGSAVTVDLAMTMAQFTGGSGSDTLTSIERLIGSNYNDTLIGNAGANLLIGGVGADQLTGRAGNDIFDFNALSEMGITLSIWDVITDFTPGQDKIDLSTLDADTTTPATNETFIFIGSAASFTGVGQVRISGGVIYGNTDTNNSTAEFAIELTGIAALTGSDFVL